MGKSQYSENLDLVQTQVTGFLRPFGFRKKARTYNRRTGGGLVHVVNLQAGPYELGEEIPGLRPNLWGLFTVNLGVYIPELDPDERTVPRKNIPEYVCRIRTRFGELVGREGDLWWPLGESWPDSAADVVRCLDEFGLPFLERYRTPEDVISRWVLDAEEHRLSNAARVDVARLLLKRGDSERARSLLQEQYDRVELKGHREYLERLASEAGSPLELA